MAAPSVGQAIELIREEQDKLVTPQDMVKLMWTNMQSDRYGAAWAKLWLIFWGMPAERRNVELTLNAQFTMNDVAAARHAQQIAEQNQADMQAIEGEFRAEQDALVLSDMEKLEAEKEE